MEYSLKIQDLTKDYGKFRLDRVSFALLQGRIMGLIGENGAGKSTTLRAALDLLPRDGGQVLFWGQPLSANRQLKEDIGVVFDGINFYETLTPAKVGRILASAFRRWDAELYQTYLHRFDLPEEREIKKLSKGMQRKLAVAAALSHRPKLLILDEPTAGLDPVMREDLLDVFLEFVQEESHSILLSSHISTDLEKIADEITFLHQGRVLFQKPKDELRYQYGILRCGAEQFAALAREDILAWRKEAYQWSVLVADKEKAKRRYPGVVVDDATIDEIMLLYVKGGQEG